MPTRIPVRGINSKLLSPKKGEKKTLDHRIFHHFFSTFEIRILSAKSLTLFPSRLHILAKRLRMIRAKPPRQLIPGRCCGLTISICKYTTYQSRTESVRKTDRPTLPAILLMRKRIIRTRSVLGIN